MNKLTDFNLTFRALPETVKGIDKIIAAAFPLVFENVVAIREYFGSNTPANDLQTIATAPSELRPNFIFFACEALFNLYITDALTNPYLFLPVKDFFAATVESEEGDRRPTTFQMAGETGRVPPMAQGTPANWYLLLVEADITLPEEEEE